MAEPRSTNTRLQEDIQIVLDLPPCDATTTLTGVIKLRRRTRIDALYLMTAVAYTGHASNHWTIALKNSSTVVASYTTDSDEAAQGSLVAGVPKAGALNATDTNLVIAAGAVLDVVLTKGASAVALPSSKLTIDGRAV